VNTQGTGEIDLRVVARGLSVALGAGVCGGIAGADDGPNGAGGVRDCFTGGVQCLRTSRIWSLLGGSSLMEVTRSALGAVFPQAQVHHGSALTAIVDGLGLAAEGAFD